MIESLFSNNTHFRNSNSFLLISTKYSSFFQFNEEIFCANFLVLIGFVKVHNKNYFLHFHIKKLFNLSLIEFLSFLGKFYKARTRKNRAMEKQKEEYFKSLIWDFVNIFLRNIQRGFDGAKYYDFKKCSGSLR